MLHYSSLFQFCESCFQVIKAVCIKFKSHKSTKANKRIHEESISANFWCQIQNWPQICSIKLDACCIILHESNFVSSASHCCILFPKLIFLKRFELNQRFQILKKWFQVVTGNHNQSLKQFILSSNSINQQRSRIEYMSEFCLPLLNTVSKVSLLETIWTESKLLSTKKMVSSYYRKSLEQFILSSNRIDQQGSRYEYMRSQSQRIFDAKSKSGLRFAL